MFENIAIITPDTSFMVCVGKINRREVKNGTGKNHRDCCKWIRDWTSGFSFPFQCRLTKMTNEIFHPLCCYVNYLFSNNVQSPVICK